MSYMKLPELDKDSPVRLDVAIEVMAGMMGTKTNLLLETTDPKLKQMLEAELQGLGAERKKMYAGDDVVIDKILNEYGPALKRMSGNNQHAA